jgi:Fibronectin type III domain
MRRCIRVKLYVKHPRSRADLFVAQHTTFQVNDLLPNTEYRFRVSSANKHGFSGPGEPSGIVITLKRKPSLNIGMLCFLFCSFERNRHLSVIFRILIRVFSSCVVF